MWCPPGPHFVGQSDVSLRSLPNDAVFDLHLYNQLVDLSLQLTVHVFNPYTKVF